MPISRWKQACSQSNKTGKLSIPMSSLRLQEQPSNVLDEAILSFSYFKNLQAVEMSHRQRIKNKTQAKFIFYINTILEYLHHSTSAVITAQVKMIISECIKKNRAGDSSCSPLRWSIVLSIQRCIGPTQWALANMYVKNSYRRHMLIGNLKKVQKMYDISSNVRSICTGLSRPAGNLSLVEICDMATAMAML